jgi:hypothetical protein
MTFHAGPTVSGGERNGRRDLPSPELRISDIAKVGASREFHKSGKIKNL